MPRFFFHVQFDEFYADEGGTELTDLDGARNVAAEIVSQLVRDAAGGLWRGGTFRVYAEDERRAPLFTFEVKALSASAGSDA
ncbi:hypothetical protein LJR225_002153 [Phenylobacterium sp. LjRoot225]|uniref:DUF6894 family protein n=1 Tax=Phenylobacterium sp. LjRoot225 TaxID=3342285 RepID=UPI003ECEFAB7